MLTVGDRRILRSWQGFWLAAGLAVAVASLAACGAMGRATTATSVVKDRHEAPLGHDATAAPLRAGPPLATGTGGVTGSEAAPGAGGSKAGATAAGSTAAGQTAAGQKSGANAAAGSSPSPPASAPASTAPPTTPAVASVSSPPCGAGDLRVAFDVQPPAGTQPPDRTRALVVLTDLAGTACAMVGFPVVEEARGPHRTVLDARHIAQPGPPSEVIVQGGMSAFAGLEWTQTAGCPHVSAFGLAMPGWRTALPVTVVVPGGTGPPLTVCSAGAVLGPVTATSEGTVAFADSLGAGT